MAYWLMKQEPSVWGWDDLVAEGKSHWDGVRNHQAAANLKQIFDLDADVMQAPNTGRPVCVPAMGGALSLGHARQDVPA